MTDISRTPAGVPTGGEFAATPRAAATEVDLPAPAPGMYQNPKFAALVRRAQETSTASWVAQQKENDATLTLMGAVIKDRYPEAKSFALSWDHDNECPDFRVDDDSILDAAGNPLSPDVQPDVNEFAFESDLCGLAGTLHFKQDDFDNHDQLVLDIEQVTAEDAKQSAAEGVERYSRLSFSAEAVHDHFEGEDQIDGLTDDELRQIGEAAMLDDATYATFHRTLQSALDEHLEEKKKAKP